MHDIMGAGHETTATTTAAVLYCVSAHPAVAARVRTELAQVVGSGENARGTTNFRHLDVSPRCLTTYGLHVVHISGGPFPHSVASIGLQLSGQSSLGLISSKFDRASCSAGA